MIGGNDKDTIQAALIINAVGFIVIVLIVL
jgi:hypothetical protein